MFPNSAMLRRDCRSARAHIPPDSLPLRRILLFAGQLCHCTDGCPKKALCGRHAAPEQSPVGGGCRSADGGIPTTVGTAADAAFAAICFRRPARSFGGRCFLPRKALSGLLQRRLVLCRRFSGTARTTLFPPARTGQRGHSRYRCRQCPSQKRQPAFPCRLRCG